ncbi:Asp23/Gls24 family envelope stress response protein [Streptomyces gilvifuscus]|uniref:Asp23/Gls24 family envelope stress response protein n=1 Tax=Streptomyces gilvifuscus TaxID=1550617 RepID=A0ABT5G4S8_9ACTN|nr:Asp23/Gls24 family envelope stress response protein [Streptomyces gilvifuscus]MDC2959863.1 Asp23/Gls24 family envelope stress response protein [Streptomyces gilvifuscus]
MSGEAGERPGVVPRGERGATAVTDRVVAKIAARVAREALGRFTESAGRVPPGRRTPHVSTSVRRAPERTGAGRDAESAAGGDAESAAGRQAVLGEARMHITVELGYPSDIGAQCAAVRREVTERIRAWAGMEVPDLAVSVERLHSAHTRHTGRERVR